MTHFASQPVRAALLITAIALFASLLSVSNDTAGAQALPTMSSTSWVATPTPIVAEPVIMVYEVMLPLVRR